MRAACVAGLFPVLILVSACGGGGGGTAAPAPPAISYGPNGSSTTQFTFVAQSSVSLAASNSGGPVATWSVSPALPAGLELNPVTGAITGTPGSFAPTAVTVVATNAGGSSEVTLSLRSDSVVLNLGASCFVDISGYWQPGVIALTSTNLLTLDCGQGEQHWALWNYVTGAVIAQGIACPVDTCQSRFLGGIPSFASMAGDIAVVPYTSAASPGPIGFQIVSTTDGGIAATIAPSGGAYGQVSSDGSYVCGSAGSGGNLTVWGPDGSVITTRSGDYASAALYCAPGRVLVANGPAGSNVIETISVPGGTSSVSPAFAGTFNSWFADGSSFISNVSTNVYIYSAAATQLDFTVLPTTSDLAGWGPWFWTDDGTTLTIYRVGASATPSASYPAGSIKPSGSTIAVFQPSFSIVDLSGATPTQTSYSPPSAIDAANAPVYAAVSASQWVLADGPDGVIVDGASLAGTPRYFGYGRIASVVGSQSRFAVATSLGNILIYSTTDLSLETTLNISAQQLAISDDGATLAALSDEPGNNLVQTVSLPSGTILNSWSYSGSPSATAITLSSSGLLLGQVLSTPSRQVTSSTGGPVLWSDTGSSSPPLLSLDDTLIAASGSAGTVIYKNDMESAAVSGTAVGWLQNDDLLVNTSSACVVFNSNGIKQSGPALPALNGPIQALSATSFFDAPSNSIYSLSTGAITWSDAHAAPGAVAGALVVFPNYLNQLVTEPY